MSVGKRVLIGFLSTLAWPVLLAAFLITTANLVVNNLNHVGNLAATVVKEVSVNQAVLDSIIDEFTKSADPKVAKEIEKNRAQIESTIKSLGSSAEFESSVTSTLNQISEAVLNGEPSVKVDLSSLATLVATAVNEAAKSTVISEKVLASIKPTVIDLRQQSGTISAVKNQIHLALLIWVFWLGLLLGLFLLTGKRIIRTFGIHFITIGIAGLAIKFIAPKVIYKAIRDSDGALYVQQIAPKILNALLVPMMNLSILLIAIGVGLSFLFWRLPKRAT